jgi:hypothetical protein
MRFHALRFICAILPLLSAGVVSLSGQTATGELRLAVKDESGAGMAASVQLVNQATRTSQAVELPPDGRYSFKNLPFGFYRLMAARAGFSPSAELVEIRSALPQNREITLTVQPAKATVAVTESDTMVDPARIGVAYYTGSKEIKERPAGLPGRGIIDMAVMQPGWAMEANGILHPRESEYDTQYVVNGFPIYDNRSPAFAPAVDADNVESMKIYTSGIPAEFGNKLGGVIELTTDRNTSPGFHGAAALQGGSFGTLGGFFSAQYVAGRTTGTVAAEGFVTDHYLDPPVTADYTNHGSSTSFTASLERDISASDRLRLAASHRQTWFMVPNDLLQQAAGQRQDRSSGDNEGQISYQRVFSPGLLGAVRAMVRDVAADLWSNPLATPIEVHQDRGFREAYGSASLSGHKGRHEWKAGFEGSYASIRERFGYHIISYRINPGNVRVFDRDLPPVYEFAGHAPDREQSVYAQDLIRMGSFTFSAGLRFDHYNLLVDETGFSPRLGMSWHSTPLGLTLHASYDRIFGTPPFENLLVSAAPSSRFSTAFYLPLRASRGNYYEGGLTKAMGKRVRLDASYFRREVNDFRDDDVLLNTGVSFPIAFHHASIRGVEVKLDVPRWGPFSGFLSYANTLGTGQLPISGGLFLDDTDAELLSSRARFPISQDIRNTARAVARWQISRRLWTSWNAAYSSGLPVEDAGDLPNRNFLLAQYGAEVLDKVDMSRSRVAPSFSLGASAGVEVWKREKRSVTFQADALNLTNRFNLINFAGLLSGTAIGPPRSFGLRLRAEF